MTDGILTDFYLPDRMAVLRVPSTPGPAPLMVVVPGGGWVTAEPVDYRPLAEALTAAGVSTSLINYSTTQTGTQFPTPIDDVACAVRWSAFQLDALGYPPTEIYLVGHSAGGQLVMMTALANDRFGGDCPMPKVEIDGVVGAAGVYDTFETPVELFPDGGTAEERTAVDPIETVTNTDNPIPPLRVLLLTGADDTIVPAAQAVQLADALRARGLMPESQILPLPHNMGFPLSLEIAPIIARWILRDAYVEPTPTPVASAPPAPVSSAPPAPAGSAPPAPAASAVPAASGG